MTQKIKILTKVQLRGLFGIHALFYERDPRKKRRALGMGVLWLLMIGLLAAYMGGYAYAMTLLGMGELVSAVLFFLSSAVMLFFTMLKAGSVIFQMQAYELLVSFPVSGAAIVVSRFLTMYVTNFLMSMAVMLPGTAVYVVMEKPGILFYLYSFPGMLLLPFFPISLATGAGALITAVSARMRHKSLVTSALTLLLALAVLCGSMFLSGNAERMTDEMLIDLAGSLSRQLESVYPPAVWYRNAAVEGSLRDFLLLLAVSFLPFAALMAVISRHFYGICSALHAVSAKNDYKMGQLLENSPLKALWKREAKRYFASSVYVVNTLIGYIMMALLSIGLVVVGPERLEELIGIPDVITRAFPLLLSVTAALMSTTACSVSMEGKQWWIVRTLPITGKRLFDSKILWNLTVALPFYLISVVLGLIALGPNLPGGIWIAVLPAAYILFSAVAGITVNLCFPVFSWENETQVVKQSASVMLAMLLGFVAGVAPLLALFALPKESADMVMAVTLTVILFLTAILYRKNNRKNLLEI